MPGVFTQDDWFVRLSEPVRARPRNSSLVQFFAVDSRWTPPTVINPRFGWLEPLSEPVRSKPPLPRGAVPHLIIGLKPQPEFWLSVTETGDTASLTFSKYIHKNLARVAITEIPPDGTRVTIREIRYGRNYS